MDAGPESGLRAWVDYLRDLGIYDLYRRDPSRHDLPSVVLTEEALQSLRRKIGAQTKSKSAPNLLQNDATVSPSQVARGSAGAARVPAGAVQPRAVAASPKTIVSSREPVKTYFPAEAETAPDLPPELAAPMPKPNPLESLLPTPPPVPSAERGAALERLRVEIGDCTRCPLAYAGRHTIVFGEGDPNAALMFVGEGPGADEDASGRPFVGKAGQLLNNMIGAMGLGREQVYIANVVKCRPPANRTPEFAEASTCSPFLLGQINIVRPRVIVALGATAATYVLGVRQSLASLRGQWLRCRDAKVAVTFHPAFLLRDPRQKAEAWKDLQRVMAELDLKPSTKGS